MPGIRLTSFRSGDLAEDLGIFLLKGVAVVAEVECQEDVGLDAVATLLRPDDDVQTIRGALDVSTNHRCDTRFSSAK